MARARVFREADLPAAAELAERARAADPSVEPFGAALAQLWHSERARRELWRVVDGAGVAMALQRDARTLDLYGAVEPRARRKGVGTALIAPALAARLALRVALREPCPAGAAFLHHHGFAPEGAALLLQREGAVPELPKLPVRTLDVATEGDRALLAQLSAKSAPEGLRLSSKEYARLDLALVAELDGSPAAYVCATLRGESLAIEELGTLPAARRKGLARALVCAALRRSVARSAQLQVDSENEAARALYRSLAFREVAARTLYLRPR